MSHLFPASTLTHKCVDLVEIVGLEHSPASARVSVMRTQSWQELGLWGPWILCVEGVEILS